LSIYPNEICIENLGVMSKMGQIIGKALKPFLKSKGEIMLTKLLKKARSCVIVNENIIGL